MEFASSSLSSSSSSFLTSEPHFIHDVFINFGGEDIGRRFVSHLHSVLLQSQVKTFISQENLHEGMKLEEQMRAIRHTKITIIVLSKSYTESPCCLLVLEKIIECHETFGQIVLPVFYEIDPLDVRHQKDDFGKALEDTARRSYSGEQLQHAPSRWSSALNRVAGMTGWDDTDFRTKTRTQSIQHRLTSGRPPSPDLYHQFRASVGEMAEETNEDWGRLRERVSRKRK
ncbi:Disease resistance protein [Vigna angularis]|uniref:Disease resistance protein n=1 Tax=Phaseolus angularis TaxID=3914 RepID=A0A8T0JTA1_PHAAN|nr:Disease resistance protein [Vigna angularis]